MKLYKTLIDGKSIHGGNLEWDLPKNGKPGKWHTVKGDLSIYNRGLHLTTKPYKWYKWGCTCYGAEAKGIEAWDDDKYVCRSARLVKEVPHPKWWKAAEKFVNEDIPNINWLKPDRKPLKKWKVFYGDSWAAARAAAGDAAWDAAGDATWAAAWDAARAAARDAARAAARAATRDVAWAAARDAAWAAGDAAWDAAGDATWAAAWDATWDAQLQAYMEITSDLEIAKKHRQHAKARMQVWRKGYALLCDVDGVLYVYAPNEYKPKD